MKTRILNIWDDFRESFWFAPALLSVMAIPAALGLLELDHHLAKAGILQTAFVRDAAGARQILSSVAGTVMTLAGIVFSITLVAISMASSQFGSRLLRCYMTDSIADRVVGVLMGSGLFSIVVMEQVREQTDTVAGFVPQISTATAAIMGFVSVSLLIWFVHDTAVSIQAPRLIAAVARDLDDAADRLFPEPLVEHPRLAAAASSRTVGTANVKTSDASGSAGTEFIEAAQDNADRDDVASGYRRWPSLSVKPELDGYVEGVALDGLVRLASRHQGVIEVQRRPGHFVSTVVCIAEIYSPELPEDDELQGHLRDELRSHFIVASRRTPRQDITCSIIELVEVAVRALSPGINNPLAAMNCIDRLGATLSRLARRQFPAPYHRDDRGIVRCVLQPPDFAGLMHDAFAQIRQFGGSSVAVCIRLIEAFQAIASQASRPEDLQAVRMHAEAVRAAFRRHEQVAMDTDDFTRRFDALCRLLDRPDR